VSDSSPPLYGRMLLKPELEGRAKRFLVPGERLVIVVRHHLAAIIIPVLIAVVLALVAMGIDIFSSPDAGELRLGAWAVAGVAFLYMAWNLAVWSGDLLIVTNKRILHTHGVITRSYDALPLGKVNDMRVERDLLGRILGYGRFNAKAVGDAPLGRRGLDFISHVEETWLEISNLLYGPGAKSPKEPQEVRVVGAILPDMNGEPVEIVLPPVSVKSPADDDKVHPVNAAMLPVRVFRDGKGERAFETDVTTTGNKRRRIRFFR
jgi:hypothetical protein